MKKAAKYVIFRTKWGYFGLAGSPAALERSVLPVADRREAQSLLLAGWLDSTSALEAGHRTDSPQSDKHYFREVQAQISAYFDGFFVTFGPEIAVDISHFSRFTQTVLTHCRDIGFGRSFSYRQLAERTGNPTAARAVGNALARNPVPLIIPCHRILPVSGCVGGFTAPGGPSLKKRLLDHEKHTIADQLFRSGSR